jgi:multiple sugar transport system permease protein
MCLPKRATTWGCPYSYQSRCYKPRKKKMTTLTNEPTNKSRRILSKTEQERINHTLSYLLAVALSAILIFPLFWMVSTSFKTLEEANAPKPVWLPAEPQWTAYQQILSNPDWLLYISNTIFVTVLAVGGTLVSVTMVAYAFGRLQWPGRDAIFYIMLGTLMLPVQTTLVPQYVLFNRLGWVDTFNPIIIPGFFAGGAAMIFLLRQFLMSIPRELDEAALIDGASQWQIFWYVILPLMKPALVTVGLLLLVGTWNSLQFPLIYLQSKGLHTLPIAILNLINPQANTQPWPLIMATSLIAVLPLIVIFMFAQRYFTESIVLTGSKG